MRCKNLILLLVLTVFTFSFALASDPVANQWTFTQSGNLFDSGSASVPSTVPYDAAINGHLEVEHPTGTADLDGRVEDMHTWLRLGACQMYLWETQMRIDDGNQTSSDNYNSIGSDSNNYNEIHWACEVYSEGPEGSQSVPYITSWTFSYRFQWTNDNQDD
jgi:hypothetical protein